jgi:nucleoside-diphosphate-sugar epimerase
LCIAPLASPFVLLQPKNAEKELYAPARDGTLNVLRAVAAATPRPKRVVVTSSVASIAYGHDAKKRDPALPCTDDTW